MQYCSFITLHCRFDACKNSQATLQQQIADSFSWLGSPCCLWSTLFSGPRVSNYDVKSANVQQNLDPQISCFVAFMLKHRAWMVIMVAVAPAPHRSSRHGDHLQQLQQKGFRPAKSTTFLLSHNDLQSISGHISVFPKMYKVKEPWHTGQYQIVSVYACATFLRPIAHCLNLSYSKSHSAQSNWDSAKRIQKIPNGAVMGYVHDGKIRDIQHIQHKIAAAPVFLAPCPISPGLQWSAWCSHWSPGDSDPSLHRPGRHTFSIFFQWILE